MDLASPGGTNRLPVPAQCRLHRTAMEAVDPNAIRASTSAVFMVNNLMTKHFGFEEEWKKNTDLFDEWGKHPNDKKLPAWMQLPSVYQNVG